jgi:hypothetical protein
MDFKHDGLGFATLAFDNLCANGRPGTAVWLCTRKGATVSRPAGRASAPATEVLMEPSQRVAPREE